MKIINTNDITVTLRDAQRITGLNIPVIKKAVRHGFIEDTGTNERYALNLFDLYRFCEMLHAGKTAEFSGNILLFPIDTIENIICYRYIDRIS